MKLQLIALLVVLSGALAHAQDVAPVDAPAAVPDANAVEWKAQSKVGLLLSGGNSRSASIAAGLSGSRKSNDNKFSGEAALAYLRSSVVFAEDRNGNALIDDGELGRISQLTSQSWLLKARYDRFFAEANTVFVSASASSDVPAGKEFIAGGQAGYSRRLYKTDRSESSVEAGYDFSYEKYTSVELGAVIHSGRVALANATRIGANSALTFSAEALVNLNEESAPNPDGAATVAPLQDFRANVSAALTSQLTERLSVGLSAKLKYDRVPAPRAPFALPYAPGFIPFADTFDTVGEASLIYTLL